MGILAKISNRYEGLAKISRRMFAISKGARLGAGVIIGKNVEFRFTQSPSLPKNIIIGERTVIDSGTILDAHGGFISIGHDTIIGPNCIIYGHGGVAVGNHCLVSPKCVIYSSNHGIPDRDRKFRDTPDVLSSTTVGDDCWIGSGASVMSGVTIGPGALVGAGSVITKDIAEFALANGIPAKIRGFRHSVSMSSDGAK